MTDNSTPEKPTTPKKPRRKRTYYGIPEDEINENYVIHPDILRGSAEPRVVSRAQPDTDDETPRDGAQQESDDHG